MLARLLREGPVRTAILIEGRDAMRERLSKPRSDSESFECDSIGIVSDFSSQLDKIVEGAGAFLKNDEDLRHFFDLQFATEKSVITTLLWPRLFELWEQAGRRVAHTPEGPLFRFLNLVHEVGNLPEPKHSTFKDAVARWKREEQSKRYPGGARWREKGD
ncbi:hypothetical protein DC522_21745 [Microvirga sp. KLBC 81]|nr:hypothetical protein DC522_21745 [Microvirga sp. KLBC 81]